MGAEQGMGRPITAGLSSVVRACQGGSMLNQVRNAIRAARDGLALAALRRPRQRSAKGDTSAFTWSPKGIPTHHFR